MTLLPSFNGKKTWTVKEIPTGLDYLITGAKRLRFASHKFFLLQGTFHLKRKGEYLYAFGDIWS